jgi:two-component system sensor histidine kinase TctE
VIDALASTEPRRSLRSRMLWRVLLPLAATWFVGSAGAFYLSWGLAGRAFDRALLDDAYAIAANVGEKNGALVLNLSPREVDNVLFDREEKEYYSIYDEAGRLIAGNADLRQTAPRPTPAADFWDSGVDGEPVRIAQLRSEGGRPFTVVLGQTTRSRGLLLRGLLGRSLLPQVVLLLLLGAYLWRQITHELAPLGHLQRELDRRHSSDLDPVTIGPISSDVERLRGAVNSLLARIAQGVQAQREFAGNVAHDLRTPLAGIRALAEYGLARDEPAVWQQQLRSIVHSEDRASRLVDQLLALALADEAQNSVKVETVRIDELVRRVLISFVARADAAGVDLGADGLDGPLSARAAPVLLEGVLANLIDNALRYGRGEAPTLTVAIWPQDGAVLIAVTDNGPGLEFAQRERLARRWTQGLAGVELGAGNGLGLAIASRYATLMGGQLILDSGPGGRGLSAIVRLGAVR